MSTGTRITVGATLMSIAAAALLGAWLTGGELHPLPLVVTVVVLVAGVVALVWPMLVRGYQRANPATLRPVSNESINAWAERQQWPGKRRFRPECVLNAAEGAIYLRLH